MMKNYYKILDIKRDSSIDEIKKKFKELALEFHPDVSKHEKAHDIFVEINEAYQILGNDNERFHYDKLYDKYIAKSPIEINNEQEIKDNINETIKKAQYKASNDSKVKYADYIKDLDCFFKPEYKADGKPYNFYVHKTTGIAGGTGPTGSIKAKLITISIPRSKKAARFHNVGLITKSIFLLLSFIPYFVIFADNKLILKLSASFVILLIGGLITKIYYKINRVKPKYFYTRKYYLVQKYLKNGYSVGFHPFISTTPFGLIYHLFRILL
jgi:curved DNA-binding protein CbpA